MHKFKTSCSKDKLKEIRRFVEATLKKVGMADTESNKIVLAIDEVCANMIIHSNHCNPSECVEICIQEKNKGTLTFDISDSGEGFDYSKYKQPNLDEIIEQRKKGGLGIMLVKKIMDSIEFSQVDNKNVCRLVKHIKS